MPSSIRSRKNLILVLIIVFALLLAAAIRVGYIQLVKGEEYKERALSQQTTDNQVVLVQYESAQLLLLQYSDRGERYDASQAPAVAFYNEYFGGGMNGIVFQEMREARQARLSGQTLRGYAGKYAGDHPEDARGEPSADPDAEGGQCGKEFLHQSGYSRSGKRI